MSPEMSAKLAARFPSFFRRGVVPRCGGGWYRLVERMCLRLERVAGPAFAFDKFKVKYGTLRVYASGFSDHEDRYWAEVGVLTQAEVDSRLVCEDCGSQEDVVTSPAPKGYWVASLCGACRVDPPPEVWAAEVLVALVRKPTWL